MDYDDFCGLNLGEYESLEVVSRIAQGIAEHGEAFATWAGYVGERNEEALSRFKARLALDYVRQLVPLDQPSPGTKAKGRTQAQRWRTFIDDLYSLASGASHDDPVTEDFTWSRDDAVMIVAAVAGLLVRLPRTEAS